MTTLEEKRAYARGYTAGRKRAATPVQDMWFQAYCAALQGLLVSRDWETGEKLWITAGRMADETLRQHGKRIGR